MARKIRIEFAGAVYHVMARGNQGQPVFADDRDRKLWLHTLGEAGEKTGWRIPAYVMMNHHYPLLLETPAGHLVAGMRWFQEAYTQRYNSRHRCSGDLLGEESGVTRAVRTVKGNHEGKLEAIKRQLLKCLEDL